MKTFSPSPKNVFELTSRLEYRVPPMKRMHVAPSRVLAGRLQPPNRTLVGCTALYRRHVPE